MSEPTPEYVATRFFFARYTVKLSDEALTVALEHTGKPGMPRTVEEFVQRAVCFALRAQDNRHDYHSMVEVVRDAD